jgi:hypothetical protein
MCYCRLAVYEQLHNIGRVLEVTEAVIIPADVAGGGQVQRGAGTWI